MSPATKGFAVCVYCGARNGVDPAYHTQAAALGQVLAQEGWQLVYGAGDVGLMGAVARAAQAAGGDTLGVIPVHLLKMEVGKTDLTRFVVTETMHERKKVMYMNSNAIVVLPGGAGSLDEFFEVLTWRQLGLHAKPIYLLNVKGYWSPLVALIDHVIDQGFADPSLAGFITVVETVDELARALRATRSSDTDEAE
ncbi:MAG: LOG family protein [Paracoccaceae bacterium]|uniref:LOG family protein n=1 Tax=Seohaeicola saemankumensis TaxID=481181 RepID=UPI001E5D1268|nr:TIGR00730 family Rossman fold protein [Seohaeicola saemankumensis]MCD1624409.1 TIGR00730 family Rossman fold protein [Seohaeicola saemankumensis]